MNFANCKDWQDVYSVKLYSALEKQPSFFLNSESIQSVTKIFPLDPIINIYTSDNPFVRNLDKQLASMQYKVNSEKKSDSFNLDLDPETGNYILISSSNYRLSVSAAPYAVRTNAWVFIVDDNNVDQVVSKIRRASNVLAIGTFPRSVLGKIEPHFDEWINTENIFRDTEKLAEKFGSFENVVLTDGSTLEDEFFSTKNPIIISGPNKVLDETIVFLQQNNVKSVVVVGNHLSVVGEQIREKTNKKISVFVKFGQSSIETVGQIYALSMFPLPTPELKLDVSKVIYNPLSEKVVVYYNNIGNAGMFFLSTFVVADDEGRELGSASDDSALFIGSGEVLPLEYDLVLPIDKITENTEVRFFASYGFQSSALDFFLTNTDKYGLPFIISLQIEEIKDVDVELKVIDIAYYSSLKRIGIQFENPGTQTIYYAVRINDLIVNGLPENLYKSDSIAPGKTATTYLPVVLDKIDMQENKVFHTSITYGANKDSLFRKITSDFEFNTKAAGGITGLVTGIGEGRPGSIIFLVVVIALGVGVFLFVKKRRD